jgi:hypothetical protein
MPGGFLKGIWEIIPLGELACTCWSGLPSAIPYIKALWGGHHLGRLEIPS